MLVDLDKMIPAFRHNWTLGYMHCIQALREIRDGYSGASRQLIEKAIKDLEERLPE